MKHSTVHAWLMGVWGVLLIPTLLLWRESLVYIVAMSWYAIWVGHWSAREAAQADEAAKAADDG